MRLTCRSCGCTQPPNDGAACPGASSIDGYGICVCHLPASERPQLPHPPPSAPRSDVDTIQALLGERATLLARIARLEAQVAEAVGERDRERERYEVRRYRVDL